MEYCGSTVVAAESLSYFILLYGALFLLHVFIIARYKWNIFKNTGFIFLVSLFYVIISMSVVSNIYTITPRFLDSGYVLSPPQPAAHLLGGKLMLIGFMVLTVSQIGPVLMRLFLYRFDIAVKNRTVYFLYVLVGSIIFQVLAFLIAVSIQVINRPPPPHLLPMESLPIKREIKEVEIQMPTLAPRTIQFPQN